MASRPSSRLPPTSSSASASASAKESSTNGSIRRNLFHSQLSRRGTTLSSASTTSTSASTTHLSATLASPPSSEIVVRTASGDYDLGSYPNAFFSATEQHHGHGQARHSVGAGPADDEDAIAKEAEEIAVAKVVEMYRSRTRVVPSEPSEALGLVQASLRRRVQELEEDAWMFEGEPSRPGGGG